MLYPTELLAHILEYCSGKRRGCQPKKLFYLERITTAFSAIGPYTVPLAKKGGNLMVLYCRFCTDLDDLIFDKEDGGPSER